MQFTMLALKEYSNVNNNFKITPYEITTCETQHEQPKPHKNQCFINISVSDSLNGNKTVLLSGGCWKLMKEVDNFVWMNLWKSRTQKWSWHYQLLNHKFVNLPTWFPLHLPMQPAAQTSSNHQETLLAMLLALCAELLIFLPVNYKTISGNFLQVYPLKRKSNLSTHTHVMKYHLFYMQSTEFIWRS